MDFDFKPELVNEPITKTPKDQTSSKLRPKDFVINTLTSILIIVVMGLINGFIDSEFKFQLMFTWGIGLLVIANWIGGIGFAYTMRKNGIGLAMQQDDYITAENKKQEAFAKIKDYVSAQKLLDKKIEEDYLYRKSVLENNIAKQIQHKMPDGKMWKQGQALPDKTRAKIKIMVALLERMEPERISLVELSEKEASTVPKSIFRVQKDPTTTGAKWFATKGLSKMLWFALMPILLSVLAGALSGGAAFKSFMMIAGTLAFMIFNGGYAFATAYDAVARKGVDRSNRITRILKIITDNQ